MLSNMWIIIKMLCGGIAILALAILAFLLCMTLFAVLAGIVEGIFKEKS